MILIALWMPPTFFPSFFIVIVGLFLSLSLKKGTEVCEYEVEEI